MSVDDEARNHAMVEFLGTFTTLSGAPPEDIADLSDGVALFEALSEISPEDFDPTTIARHLGENWALKASNLRKLVRNLETYYHESLGKHTDDFDNLDLKAIAMDNHGTHVLVELVAAAAVTCASKTEYVTRIMQMSPESQTTMMTILEATLKRLDDYVLEDEDDDDDLDENELVFGDNKDDIVGIETGDEDEDDDVPLNLFGAGHLEDYDKKEELETALMEARRELAALKSQASVVDEDNERAQSKLRALVEDLQDRLSARQDELTLAEEAVKASNLELNQIKLQLHESEEQKAQLADELDVARHKGEQLRKAEATLVAYKKKLEAVGVMNQQMTDLEEQAANYLRQIMDLESEVKQKATLQKTVDELQTKLSVMESQSMETDDYKKSSAAEVAQLKNQLTAAENAKKLYEEELAELRAQVAANGDENIPADGLSPLATTATTAETREKMMRMEIENQKLKEQVEELKASGKSYAAPGSDAKEIKRLKDELQKKEMEMKKIGNDKDKLEAYTKRTLAKFQDKYLVALQECKAKLKEKQDKIEALESRGASEKSAQKREERLLSSTIYELGLAIMQDRLKDR